MSENNVIECWGENLGMFRCKKCGQLHGFRADAQNCCSTKGDDAQ